MQLRPKLLVAFLVVSLLPLAVVGLVIYRSTIAHTERLVGRRLQGNVPQVADAVDDFMVGRVEDMQRFGRSQLLAALVPPRSALSCAWRAAPTPSTPSCFT